MRLQAVSIGALSLLWLGPALVAQPNPEVKEKAPMYSYVANWEMPRDKFKDMQSQLGSNDSLMKKQLANGALIGFGYDVTVVHQPGESTHDIWWSSMSWGGMMKALEAIQSGEASSSPVLAAGKHDDKIFVSRYYNWRSGAFTNGYTRMATWKLKAGAPDDAVDQIAKGFAVPMFEKLLAEGAIYEYEIDQEALHSSDPGNFYFIYIANGPEGLDKATAALGATGKAVPLALSRFGSWVEYSAHRDGLSHTTATYK